MVLMEMDFPWQSRQTKYIYPLKSCDLYFGELMTSNLFTYLILRQLN